MTIRNWKRRSNTRHSFLFESRFIPFISILGSSDRADLKGTKVKPKWQVIIRNMTMQKNIIRKSFANKKQALRFALIFIKKSKFKIKI